LRDEIDRQISVYEKKLDQYKADKVIVDKVIERKSKDKRKPRKVGFRDWTNCNVNIQTGCSNNCIYCYAKTQAYRREQLALGSWADQTIRRHDVDKARNLYHGLVGFPSTHDITAENIDEYLYVLGRLLRAGNEVLIVSKPRLDCIRQICDACYFFKDKIRFRFTIGAMDNDILGFWEPNAPGYKERMDCLEFAYNQGFRTSVSMEPMLDTPRVEKQIADLRQFVTEDIWLGTMNYLEEIKEGADDDLTAAINKVEAGQTVERLTAIYQTYKDDKVVKWKTDAKEKIEAHIQQNGEVAK
jgi:DNA repair photolyase